MVAIPVLIRPGLDEGHKESSENDEEKMRKEIRYGRNTYKQQQMEREAETERRKLVKRES